MKNFDYIKGTVLALLLYSLILFCISHYPAKAITFRVEQWDIYRFYSEYTFNFLQPESWLKIAFWTPFNDFRCIPLAYLWNFVEFKLLGSDNFSYLIFSSCLHLINCALIANFVSILIGRSNPLTGIFGFILLLLFPAKFEVIIWTFFSYKLFHVTLILISLTYLERYLQSPRKVTAYISIACLFISYFFYEASVPIGFVYLWRLFVNNTPMESGAKKFFLFLICASYVAYALIYLTATYYVPSHLNMVNVQNQLIGILGNLWMNVLTGFASLYCWLSHGLLMGNSGLPLRLVPTPFHLSFVVLTPADIIFTCLLIWGCLLATITHWLRLWRNCLYILLILLSGIVLVLIGRAIPNGPEYLARMSIYNYFPSVFLAALLGYPLGATLFGSTSFIRRSVLLFSFFLLITLLSITNYRAIKQYITFNKPLAVLIEEVGNFIRNNPDKNVHVENIRVPFAPTWSPFVTHQSHAYNVLRLRYGDKIVKVPLVISEAP